MRRMRNPNELFVGDLSFFCQEKHLFELFSAFGSVVEARIKRSDKGGRTLMYGFVRMESLKAALDATKALNGHMLLGREIRVQLSLTNTYYDKSAKAQTSFSVQVNFSSQFASEEEMVEPNEALLRTLLEPMGELVDVVVRDFVWNKEHNRQEGFAIATYASEETANRALNEVRECDLQGISVSCVPLAKPLIGSKQLPPKQAHHSSPPANLPAHNAFSALSAQNDLSRSQESFSSHSSHTGQPLPLTHSHTGNCDGEAVDLQESLSSLSLSRQYNAQISPRSDHSHSLSSHNTHAHSFAHDSLSHSHAHSQHFHTNSPRYSTQHAHINPHTQKSHSSHHPHFSHAHSSQSHSHSHTHPDRSHHALSPFPHTAGSVGGGETSSESYSSADSLSLAGWSNSALDVHSHAPHMHAHVQRQGYRHVPHHPHNAHTHVHPSTHTLSSHTLAAHNAHMQAHKLDSRLSLHREYVDSGVAHHNRHSHMSQAPHTRQTHVHTVPYYERDSSGHHHTAHSLTHGHTQYAHNPYIAQHNRPSPPLPPQERTTSFNRLLPPPHPHTTHGHFHAPHTTQRGYTVSAISRLPHTHSHTHSSPLDSPHISPHISPRTHYSFTDSLPETSAPPHNAFTQQEELSPRSLHATQGESFFGSLPDYGEPLEPFSLDAQSRAQVPSYGERIDTENALSLPQKLWENEGLFSRNITPTAMSSRVAEGESVFSFDSFLRTNDNSNNNNNNRETDRDAY